MSGKHQNQKQVRSYDIHWDKEVTIVRITKVVDGKTGEKLEDIEEVIRTLPSWGLGNDFNAMITQYGNQSTHFSTELGKLVTGVRVPEDESIVVTVVDKPAEKHKKKPLMCLYTAVEEYVEKMLGIRFTYEDREFFEQHLLATSDGVPLPDTLRVAQELIDPYGLRISRVRLAPGMPPRGDLAQWRSILGINPIALGDRQTSNAEYQLQVKDTTDYAFEHSATALFPSVACGSTSDVTVVSGSGGGHALYVPPRRRANGAILSFQIDRNYAVGWKRYPVFPAIADAKGEEVPAAKDVEVFDLDEWWRTFRVMSPPGSTTPAPFPPQFHGKVGGGNNGSPSRSVPLSVFVGGGAKGPENLTTQTHCYFCKQNVTSKNPLTFWAGVPGICDQCWEKVLKGLNCPFTQCGSNQGTVANLAGRHAHSYVDYDWQKQRIYMRCRTCYRDFYLPRTMGKRVIRALMALEHYHNSKTVENVIEASKAVPTPTEKPGRPDDPGDVPPVQ